MLFYDMVCRMMREMAVVDHEKGQYNRIIPNNT